MRYKKSNEIEGYFTINKDLDWSKINQAPVLKVVDEAVNEQLGYVADEGEYDRILKVDFTDLSSEFEPIGNKGHLISEFEKNFEVEVSKSNTCELVFLGYVGQYKHSLYYIKGFKGRLVKPDEKGISSIVKALQDKGIEASESQFYEAIMWKTPVKFHSLHAEKGKFKLEKALTPAKMKKLEELSKELKFKFNKVVVL